MTSRQRRAAVVIAVLVAVVWGIGVQLPVGAYLGGELSWLDTISVWWFSVMLLTLAPVAWLLQVLVPGNRAVAGVASVVALAAVAGATGNLLEDQFRVPGAEYLYGIGLFGLLLGLIALAITLAAARRWLLGGVTAATLVGFAVAAGHGPPVMPLLWLVVAVAALRAGPSAPEALPDVGAAAER